MDHSHEHGWQGEDDIQPSSQESEVQIESDETLQKMYKKFSQLSENLPLVAQDAEDQMRREQTHPARLEAKNQNLDSLFGVRHPREDNE